MWKNFAQSGHTVSLQPHLSHRNLRTRRRIHLKIYVRTRRRSHLCMQDDQIARKFMELAPADMARQKYFLVVNNLIRQLRLHQLELAL
jgi:hypothetical protein